MRFLGDTFEKNVIHRDGPMLFIWHHTKQNFRATIWPAVSREVKMWATKSRTADDRIASRLILILLIAREPYIQARITLWYTENQLHLWIENSSINIFHLEVISICESYHVQIRHYTCRILWSPSDVYHDVSVYIS